MKEATLGVGIMAILKNELGNQAIAAIVIYMTPEGLVKCFTGGKDVNTARKLVAAIPTIDFSREVNRRVVNLY